MKPAPQSPATAGTHSRVDLVIAIVLLTALALFLVLAFDFGHNERTAPAEPLQEAGAKGLSAIRPAAPELNNPSESKIILENPGFLSRPLPGKSGMPGPGPGPEKAPLPEQGKSAKAPRPTLKPIAFLTQMTVHKGEGPGGLRLLAINDPKRIKTGGLAKRPGGPCPACEKNGLAPGRGTPIAYDPNAEHAGVASYVGMCDGQYVYEFKNTSGKDLDTYMTSQSGDSWIFRTKSGATERFKTSAPLTGPVSGVDNSR